MKKKLFILSLAVVMLAVAAIGGTIAYFTDTDQQRNVMTSGTVDIEQLEMQRPKVDDVYADGDLIEFAQEAPLYPAVYNGTLDYDGSVTINGQEYNIWDESINGEVDKFVYVENTGYSHAYIRTIFAFEDDTMGTLTPNIHTLWNDKEAEWPFVDNNGTTEWLVITDSVTGVNYTVCVYTYEVAIAPGEFTEPSLMQLFLDPTTTNDWLYAFEGDFSYEVLALSQAVQAENFIDAYTALNTAFGEVTVANQATVQQWFVDAGLIG